jgi:hypothetical protein
LPDGAASEAPADSLGGRFAFSGGGRAELNPPGYSRPVRRALLLVIPLAAVGLVGAVVAIASHESDAAFIYAQQHPITVEPLQVERAVQKAREPVAGGRGSLAKSAACRPIGTSSRRRLWRCAVRYRSGNQLVYRVTIALNGAFKGADRTGAYTLSGCCIVGANG